MSNELLIFGGSASDVLAIDIARKIGLAVSKLEIKRFPDGERYLRIQQDVSGQCVAVIQSTSHHPDEYLFEYLLIADSMKDLGAKKVIAVFPYLAYARQDERFNPGEAITIETVAKLIESVGTNEFYTVDAHLHRISDISRIFTIPAYNLSAVPLLVEYISTNIELDNSVVIGPDEESEQWAAAAARILRADFDVLEKKRINAEKVEIRTRRLSVKNRDVIVVDDIISTGGTMVETIEVLRREGARKIVVGCIHPILAGNALARLYDSGADVVLGTDSIPSPVSRVSCAPVIAFALRNVKE